jgi:hypothetical protein
LKAGVCAFLQKPADSNELMDVIRTTLNPVWLQARWRRGIRAPQVLEIKVDAAEVSASTNLMVSRRSHYPESKSRNQEKAAANCDQVFQDSNQPIRQTRCLHKTRACPISRKCPDHSA